MKVIHHEKMDIYKKSVLFLSHSESIIQKLPKGRREFKDQLQREFLFIVLNFAEGYGKLPVILGQGQVTIGQVKV
ncbi:MAG: four helix bundle protein [Bacteriovoracaceae bacterium]|nr:four helix bundle protein [Bacteriovoracaceae bacterium]